MKKLFTTIAAAALTAMAVACSAAIGVSAADFSVSPAATGEILGDGNGDGAINARDILAIKRDVVNIEKAKVGADANGDGKINARDILAIKRQIVGIERLTDIAGSKVKILAVDDVNVKNMAIVAPAETDPDRDNAAFAAELLRTYIGAATGYDRAVEYGKASTEHAIYIQYDPTMEGDPTGMEDTFPRVMPGAPGELGDEGFIIEVRDGNVYITGGRLRGCMYGAFEFLEEYIGYRFVKDTDDPNDTFIYPTDIVNLKDGVYDRQVPKLVYRKAGGASFGDQKDVNTYRLARRLNEHIGFYPGARKYGFGASNVYLNAHSWAYYREEMWPNPEQGGSMSQSEWDERAMSLNYTWQPCFSGDYDEMFNGLLKCSEFVFTNWKNTIVPGQTRMSFSSMDNGNVCPCDSCRASYEQLGIAGTIIEFASRAADDYQAYYPGVKLYTILYDKTQPPEGLYVSPNLAIMYCGHPCNHHIPGTGDCGDNVTSLGDNNSKTEKLFPAWSAVSEEIYYWYYAVNYMCHLAQAPDTTHVYGDFKFFYENGVDGFYFEGDSACPGYNFEDLQAYMCALISWDADMTREEFDYKMLEYMYIMYGEGYEEIYELLTLQESTQVDGCWATNHDYAWDMYSPEYVSRSYEKELELLDTALAKVTNDAQKKRVTELYLTVHFLGLSATYDEVYVNGTEAQRAEYTSRYEWLYNYLKDNNLPIFSESAVWPLPDTCNLDKNPMDQFYGSGYAG